MMRKTHLLFAIFCYLLFIKLDLISFSLFGFVILLFAALIPDVDSLNSKIGKKLKVISHSFKHRGFFHSLLFGILATGIFYYLDYTLEFAIGYFSHILLDMMNIGRVQIFWPFKINFRGFLKTNGFAEKLLMIVLFVIDVVLIIS